MARSADVLLQPGHWKRTKGATGGTGKLDGTTYNEKDLTPVVVERAAARLRSAGYSVFVVAADDWDDTEGANVKIAVSVHFDSSSSPCSTGTSFGYNDPTDKPFADVLRSAWLPWIDPSVRIMPDNFTRALAGYGDFADWTTTDAELVWEICELSCPDQLRWILPRLEWAGDILAHSIDAKLGGSAIGHPEATRPPVAAAAFSDVPADHTFADDIAWAAKHGILGGSSGSFFPSAPLTRAQAAAVARRLARLLGFTG